MSDWAEKLKIPLRFSMETTAVLKSGVPTRKPEMKSLVLFPLFMLVNTFRPTSEDYNIICKKLIDKHPGLKDSVGSGYVSVYNISLERRVVKQATDEKVSKLLRCVIPN